jgi:uncharacterized membrane protein YqaE (UPF0057 family)
MKTPPLFFMMVFLFSCSGNKKGFFAYTNVPSHVIPYTPIEGEIEDKQIEPTLNGNKEELLVMVSKENDKADRLNGEIFYNGDRNSEPKLGKATKTIQRESVRSVKKRVVPEKQVSLLPLILLAIFFPPIAVGIKKGFGTVAFYLTVLLTALLYIPGVVYALVKILRRKEKVKMINT